MVGYGNDRLSDSLSDHAEMKVWWILCSYNELNIYYYMNQRQLLVHILTEHLARLVLAYILYIGHGL